MYLKTIHGRKECGIFFQQAAGFNIKERAAAAVFIPEPKAVKKSTRFLITLGLQLKLQQLQIKASLLLFQFFFDQL